MDALTYAGNLENLDDVISHDRLRFIRGDIRDIHDVAEALDGVDVIVNAAAESHVSKSIEQGGAEFVTTNVVGTQVLLDAIRFPSDTNAVLLEQNDAVLLLRSDNPAHIHDAHERLVGNLDVWRPTSIRRGFVGGGFDGGEGLPHKLAVAAGVPGADLIPEQAELFLGFTSTQKAYGGSSMRAMKPLMVSEDFSYMLENCRGAFFFLGQGGEFCHHPNYQFDDAIMPLGVTIFCEVVRERLGETGDAKI
jgi:hypothetical protein